MSHTTFNQISFLYSNWEINKMTTQSSLMRHNNNKNIKLNDIAQGKEHKIHYIHTWYSLRIWAKYIWMFTFVSSAAPANNSIVHKKKLNANNSIAIFVWLIINNLNTDTSAEKRARARNRGEREKIFNNK